MGEVIKFPKKRKERNYYDYFDATDFVSDLDDIEGFIAIGWSKDFTKATWVLGESMTPREIADIAGAIVLAHAEAEEPED